MTPWRERAPRSARETVSAMIIEPSPACSRGTAAEVAVRTRFRPDDEEAFYTARDELIDAYRTATQDPDSFVASTMLEYKWGYADGRIFHWTRSELEDLLLGHFPRKVSVDQEDILRVVPEVDDFLRFLQRTNRLAGDPLPDLLDELSDLRPDFATAMQDPANFGMAKSLVAQMHAEGLDVLQPEAVDRWIEEFNTRPFEARDATLAAPESESAPLPPVEIPDERELESAARSSEALARLVAFARYVGTGRKLTQKGHLTLEDGRSLVELLDTGDEVDQRIGDKTFKTHSTAELPMLTLTFRWARAAGFVKVRHGRVSMTARGASLGRKPLEDWRAALEGFLRCDPIVRRYPGPQGGHGPFWTEVLVELLQELPFTMYAMGSLDLKLLHDAAWQQVEDRFVLDRPPDVLEFWRQMMESDIDRLILGTLAGHGAVTLAEGSVSLTLLGLSATNRMLRARGEAAPVIGEHASSGASELLHACASMPLEAAEREIRVWVDARPTTAAHELGLAARSSDLPLMALHALSFVGPQGEAEVRQLLAIDSLRPHAELWLVQHGYEDSSSLSPETLQTAMVEAIAVEIDEGGPVAATAQFQSLGPEEEQAQLVERLVRADHARTSEVLETIGRYHPSKPVAKAARKAAFKRRTSRGT